MTNVFFIYNISVLKKEGKILLFLWPLFFMQICKDKLESIAQKRYSEYWYDKFFMEDKLTIEAILWSNNKFINHKKNIHSINSLSSTICSKLTQQVENILSENSCIDEMKHIIKSDIVFLLQPERMKSFISLLHKNKSLKKWSPSTLESIGREKNRDKDVNDIDWISIYSDQDIKTANQLKTWFQSHIRKTSNQDESTIDWERICDELNKLWENELADKFEYKNMWDNFKQAA